MITALLIDDEETSRITLKGKLGLFCPEVSIAGEADNLTDGMTAVLNHEPDVIFLDINLAGESGFELLEKLEQEHTLKSKIIFVTAHDEFAIKAIKFSALDYLLKPIDEEELVRAVEKIEEQQSVPGKQNLDLLIENIRQVAEAPKKIAIPTSEGIHVLKINDILRCESSSNYTKFYLAGRGNLLASKTLKEYDLLLNEYHFERVHKSHLVNLNYLKKYVQSEGGYIVMEDGAKIPVANRKKEHLLHILKTL